MASVAVGAASVVPSSARTKLLVQALENSGRVASAQRFAAELRRWAAQGRPYRGQVFQPEEVEAAISTLAGRHRSEDAKGAQPVVIDSKKQELNKKSSSSSAAPPSTTLCGGKSNSGNSDFARSSAKEFGEAADSARITNKAFPRVEVHDSAWPPFEVSVAAAETVQALGKLPEGASAGFANSGLLDGLYSLTRRRVNGSNNDDKHPNADVQIETLEGVKIHAHRALLSAVSEMFKCKFQGSFGDATAGVVDASQFQAEVVGAAVKFTYLGKCRVNVADLGVLYILADMWQFSLLAQAVSRCWAQLPIVRGLQALASLDPDMLLPGALISSLVNIVAESLDKVSTVLVPAAAPPPVLEPGQEPVIPQVNPLTQPAVGWRFVREFHDILAGMSPKELGQLRYWVSQEPMFGDTAVKFMAGALSGAHVATPEDMKRLCSKHLKSWLPEEHLCRVVKCACEAVGLADERGQAHAWLRWSFTGCPSFSTLWRLYGVLQEHQQGLLEAPPIAAEGTAPPAPVHEFPEAITRGFAVALAEEVRQGHEGAQPWEELVLGATPRAPAVEESVLLLARILPHNRRLLVGLKARTVVEVVCAALAGAPSAAVRVMGPEKIAGIYRRCSNNGQAYIRRGEQSVAKPCVLQRMLRGRGQAIRVSWKGIPHEVLQAARVEWKIHLLTDDAEVDTPLALALDEVMDPSRITAPWWICSKSSCFKQGGAGISVTREAASEAVVGPCVDAVVDWVRQGGSLQGLLQGVEDVSDEPVLLQVCQAVRVVLEQSSLTGTTSKVKVPATDQDAPVLPLSSQSQRHSQGGNEHEGLDQAANATAPANPHAVHAVHAPHDGNALQKHGTATSIGERDVSEEMAPEVAVPPPQGSQKLQNSGSASLSAGRAPRQIEAAHITPFPRAAGCSFSQTLQQPRLQRGVGKDETGDDEVSGEASSSGSCASEEEMETKSPELSAASQLVGRVAAELSALLACIAAAPNRRRRCLALFARKRRLESNPDYEAALLCLQGSKDGGQRRLRRRRQCRNLAEELEQLVQAGCQAEAAAEVRGS
mmetsp:Transcript_126792/g.253515  ORF Transcript_126792/g.253515 Transcript_126792/m.253515 type:complete len:1051 (-) Transcript_126792:8-3160(-)